MMLKIGIQPPYALMIGFELFVNKEDLGYKSFVIHALLLSFEICWDIDQEVIDKMKSEE
jgi:hypothetical protein